MDRRLSELRRRFLTTGNIDDEVRYLREALRSGELEFWEIEVAAYLGNQAAMTMDIDHPSLFASRRGTETFFVAHGLLSPNDTGELWARNLGEYPKDVLIVGMLVGFHWVLENTAIGLDRAFYDYYDSLVASFLAGEAPKAVFPEPVTAGPQRFYEISQAIRRWIMEPSHDIIIGFARNEFRLQSALILDLEVPFDEPDPVLGPKGRMDYALHLANQLTQYVLGYKTAVEVLLRK